MAIVFKSNAAYAGSQQLPGVAAVSYTAEQLYNEYSARVIADGGEIIDATKTLAAITHARTANLYGRMKAAFSASWGVKLSGGRVVKAYSLEGEDFEGFTVGTGGALPLHTTDAAGFHVIVPDVNASRVGGLLRSINPLALADSPSKYCAIVASQNELDGLVVQTAFGNVPELNTGYACAILGRNSTQTNCTAQRSDYDSTIPATTTPRLSINGGRGSGDRIGTALALQVSTGSVNLIADGAMIGSTTSGTGELADYSELSKRIYVGSTYDGVPNITASRKGQVRDVYALSAATLAEIQALTLEITARYP